VERGSTPMRCPPRSNLNSGENGKSSPRLHRGRRGDRNPAPHRCTSYIRAIAKARAPIHPTAGLVLSAWPGCGQAAPELAVPGRTPKVVCRQIADQLVGTARYDVTQVGTGIALWVLVLRHSAVLAGIRKHLVLRTGSAMSVAVGSREFVF
jgi:hypothetical protein